MRARRAPSVAIAAVLAIGACAERGDFTPQIAVQPGAAARSLWLASRAGDRAAAKDEAARVHVMAAGEELGGPNAVGRPGDLLLENGEIALVIDQLGSSAGFAESGGNLVDAADAKERKDELGQVLTYFGAFPRQGVYDAITSGQAADGSAWVEARGHELYEHELAVTTRYTLRPGERAVLLETTLRNGAASPIADLSLGDAIQWGGAEKLAPGMAVGFRGPSSGAYIGGVGRATSYAITSTDGSIDAVSGGSWTDTLQRTHVTLAPGESVSYARVLVVGARGDVASLVAELTRASGGALGALEIKLLDGAGAPVVAPAGAKVVLSTVAGAEVMTIRAPRASAVLGAEVPPGRYLVAYASGGGRRGRGPRVAVDVAAGKVLRTALAVSDAGRLRAQCAETHGASSAPTPCKVTLEGIGAPTPDFGPAHVAGPARNQVTTADGAVDVPLAPGKYRLTASRGPEYALAQTEVEVAAGDDAPLVVPLVLARVVDTAGYVATDFHQHTMLGADAAVATRDRIVSNVAEGVEVAVASEHNVVADLEPLVRAMHLEAYVVSIPGDELTTDASRKPWGHANVFPLSVDPAKPRGGAPAVRDRSAKEVFAELRAIPAPHLLQVNHPRTGLTGYFDQYRLDPATGEGRDPDYDPGFDALEVWNGRNVDARAKLLDDYFTLLRTKHVVTATADTDTHGIVGQEAGYPRTYVRSTAESRLSAWGDAENAELVRAVRVQRDVVLTSGPFLRVRANDAPIGGIARARGGKVIVKVHVECAPWFAIERLRVVRAVSPAAATDEIAVTAAMTTSTPAGARAVDATFTLRAPRDDAFVVIASGSSPMTPVLSGEPGEIAPYAMSGAIWIDGDGDGRALGR